MSVSVIIVSHNSRRFLIPCIQSVLHAAKRLQHVSTEIILVDNASSDGGSEQVQEEFHAVRIIRNRRNLGFAKACNIGIKATKSEDVILLNPDCIVDTNWMKELVSIANVNKSDGIVGSKSLRFDEKIESAGLRFYYWLGFAVNRGRGENDHGQYDRLASVIGVQFHSVLIKSDVIKDIGLLDESMFLFGEDMDFCLRARLRGWNVIFCPSSIVRHYVGGSRGKKKSWKLRSYAFAHGIRMILKNYEFRNALKYGTLSFLRYLSKGMMAMFMARKEEATVYLYAILWNMMNLPVRERILTQRSRLIQDRDLFVA